MASNRIRVLVGSQNPTKINATRRAFSKTFKKKEILVYGVEVSSGVSDQPMGGEETKKGAKNRVKALSEMEADFYVGIEGGCEYDEGKLFAFAWVVTKKESQLGLGKTSCFQLPKEIQKLIELGVELGEADDVVFKRKNSKTKGGAVGILTKSLIDRTKYYEEAVIMSLIPFINKELLF